MGRKEECRVECKELEAHRREVERAYREAARIRMSEDISIHEDFELAASGHKRIYALIQHLLAGHDGEPCPAGDRPIVKDARRRALAAAR